MRSKSAEIQEQINAIETAIQQGAADAQLNLWEMQRGELKKELAAALAEEAQQAALVQAQQERVQAQEQAVESIELPYDFNEVLENSAANDMIIEVVKDVKRQADADHNAEVDKLNSEWSDKLRAAADREVQLKRQNDEIQSALEAERKQAIQDAQEITKMEQHIAQLGMEKQDAEAKRDAAVSKAEGIELLLSEKQEEIDLLRNQLANSAAPKSAFDITPTDKLARMVKETNDIKAARGLARWNQTNPELAVTPLEIPVFPSPTPLDQNDMGSDSNVAEEITRDDFRNGDRIDEGSGLLQSGLADQDSEGVSTATGAEVVERRQNSVSREEHEALKLNLDAIAGELDSVKKFIGMAS